MIPVPKSILTSQPINLRWNLLYIEKDGDDETLKTMSRFNIFGRLFGSKDFDKSHIINHIRRNWDQLNPVGEEAERLKTNLQNMRYKFYGLENIRDAVSRRFPGQELKQNYLLGSVFRELRPASHPDFNSESQAYYRLSRSITEATMQLPNSTAAIEQAIRASIQNGIRAADRQGIDHIVYNALHGDFSELLNLLTIDENSVLPPEIQVSIQMKMIEKINAHSGAPQVRQAVIEAIQQGQISPNLVRLVKSSIPALFDKKNAELDFESYGKLRGVKPVEIIERSPLLAIDADAVPLTTAIRNAKLASDQLNTALNTELDAMMDPSVRPAIQAGAVSQEKMDAAAGKINNARGEVEGIQDAFQKFLDAKAKEAQASAQRQQSLQILEPAQSSLEAASVELAEQEADLAESLAAMQANSDAKRKADGAYFSKKQSISDTMSSEIGKKDTDIAADRSEHAKLSSKMSFRRSSAEDQLIITLGKSIPLSEEKRKAMFASVKGLLTEHCPDALLEKGAEFSEEVKTMITEARELKAEADTVGRNLDVATKAYNRELAITEEARKVIAEVKGRYQSALKQDDAVQKSYLAAQAELKRNPLASIQERITGANALISGAEKAIESIDDEAVKNLKKVELITHQMHLFTIESDMAEHL
jgi:hypothetical protein